MYSMQFNVAQLLKESIGATRDHLVKADIAGLDPALRPSRLLTGQVHFLRTRSGILVEGELQTEIELMCARCLDPLYTPLHLSLVEEFSPTIDVITGHRLVMEEEDKALWIDEHHILDLSDVVRQGLLLLIPMRPLCRQDCMGLCPVCGQNLNERPCDCAEKETDIRWAQLLTLR